MTADRTMGVWGSVALATVVVTLMVSPPPAQTDVDQLAWLTGCWSRVTASSVVEEHWTPPAGGAMFGVNRTVRGDRTTAHEFLQIRQLDGQLTFIAAPSGQSEASFPLERLTENSVVFAKPDHDFPQRITYLRTETGITARAESTTGEQVRVFELMMVRCQAD